MQEQKRRVYKDRGSRGNLCRPVHTYSANRKARALARKLMRYYGMMAPLIRPAQSGYLCALALVAAIVANAPAFAADADNGQRLAHRWCAACHVVSATQTRSATDQAPPFATIASRPNFGAAGIALYLLAPHPKMPDMSLTRTEAADLAAYIATLK
jgi:mono/diheme cytochrome c family protein